MAQVLIFAYYYLFIRSFNQFLIIVQLLEIIRQMYQRYLSANQKIPFFIPPFTLEVAQELILSLLFILFTLLWLLQVAQNSPLKDFQ